MKRSQMCNLKFASIIWACVANNLIWGSVRSAFGGCSTTPRPLARTGKARSSLSTGKAEASIRLGRCKRGGVGGIGGATAPDGPSTDDRCLPLNARLARWVSIVVVIIFIVFSYDKAIAGNTTVFVSVSIGTGVVVGAAGLFFHLTYSSEVRAVEDKENGGILIIPDIRPVPSNDFDQTAYHNDKRGEPLRIYFIGIKW